MARQDIIFIKKFVLGPWETNCYVIRPATPETDQCWIIDAGFNPGEMIKWIKEQELTPTQIILTHGHADHIAGVPEVCDAFEHDISVSIHHAEAEFLTNPTLNLSAMAGFQLQIDEADSFIEAGKELIFDNLHLQVFHTPGHSPGGISLYENKSQVAFVGDTLFAGSIGRFDFPTSNGPLLLKSIHEQLFTLPEETTVFPGHGPETTIGYELHTNPFVGEHAETGI